MLLGCTPLIAQVATWRSTITADQAIILDGRDTVAVYQITSRSLPDGSYARAHYLHPVYAPDGSLLTEDFPTDHFHHRGIFWAWHQVYVGDRRAGDGWECRNFSWEVDNVRTERRGRQLLLYADVTWRSRLEEKGERIALAQEQVQIRFHPVRSGHRRVDFQIHIRPLVNNLSIGGSEDAKGYGGFSWRLPLPTDVAFYAGNQPLEPTETGLAAGRRLRITGTFAEGVRQLRIEQRRHPDGGPYPWILRKQGSMQNVAFPGRKPMKIPPAGVRLAYRIEL